MIDLELYQAKKLYPFQETTVKQVLDEIRKSGTDFNLLYQLPTGGGKTVIFSEIARQYIEHDYNCFIAMVETLNNRLLDNENFIENVGLVIVDEAHYNSFRKIFQYYENCNILGVTATPLSSNKALPLKDNYNKLIVGESISNLIEKSYLANAETFSYDVNLHGLKIGSNGDFTISSSDILYSNYFMQEKLIFAYEEVANGTKTLIFNAGIET